MNAGIDYGMGLSNIDKETGIRFGVISQNSVMPEAMDDVEYDYGDPTCPKCGNVVMADSGFLCPPVGRDDYEQYGHGCADFVCETCEHTLDSQDCYGDEAIGWKYEDDGYQLVDCLDNDVFVLKSPFYTFARFCSPCVPGAGNLDDWEDGAVKTYCLGHDWFEDGKAPYPVYSVETGKEVSP